MAADDDTPRKRRGIPLEELHDQELERQQRRAGLAIPAPIEDESTGRVGVALFARLQQTSDAQVEALVDRFAERIAKRTRTETADELRGAAKRTSAHDWIRSAAVVIGLAGAGFAAWAALRADVAALPTSAEVDREPAPIRAQVADQDREQRGQRDVMIRLTGAVEGLTDAVKELRAAPPPARRRQP